MAKSIITQFVKQQLAKKSLRKTGIATLNKASDPIVQSNVRNIKIQLKNLGINPEDLTSTDDVLKALNYHNALMNQHLKQQFKGLGLGKGIKSLEKKKTPVEERPFQGFTPTIVKDKRAEFLKKYTKDGRPNDAELNALVNEHRILSEEAKRLGDAGENYEKFSQLNKRTDEIQEIIEFMRKEFPEDMASGGIARVKFNAGREGELFGIPMEDIRKFKEKERMDRTSPLAIPDDWLQRLLITHDAPFTIFPAAYPTRAMPPDAISSGNSFLINSIIS